MSLLSYNHIDSIEYLDYLNKQNKILKYQQ